MRVFYAPLLCATAQRKQPRTMLGTEPHPGVSTPARQHARVVVVGGKFDSRLGFREDGGGIIDGGRFGPELVRWNLGQIQDTLARAGAIAETGDKC
jgi:hypothetical protein